MIRDPSCPVMPKALTIESCATKSGNVSLLLTLIAGGKELKCEYIIKPENAREIAAILTRHADELEGRDHD